MLVSSPVDKWADLAVPIPRLEGVDMEYFRDRQEKVSSSSAETKENPMEKPQIHTTESGTQSVRAVDVVRSKAGWAEIQRLREANLVRPATPTNGNSSSQQSNDNK